MAAFSAGTFKSEREGRERGVECRGKGDINVNKLKGRKN
jgi:hypothetical protein